jgi:hypothetical protein
MWGSLGELRSVIAKLQRLHDFLQSEGKRLQREISEYAEVSKSATSATAVNWGQSRALEKAKRPKGTLTTEPL